MVDGAHSLVIGLLVGRLYAVLGAEQLAVALRFVGVWGGHVDRQWLPLPCTQVWRTVYAYADSNVPVPRGGPATTT